MKVDLAWVPYDECKAKIPLVNLINSVYKTRMTTFIKANPYKLNG